MAFTSATNFLHGSSLACWYLQNPGLLSAYMSLASSPFLSSLESDFSAVYLEDGSFASCSDISGGCK
ncbi:hypothetical protein JCGZ_17145 [Jatropha curcas]|uniref:Uncharacterized protein n=1 Tax=Jatropha curcas TaxID=180498 RepID=A0A067KDG2_JATCU|nr:hypothetical protein JCGZ_17145 [Jatropha curcas]